MNRYLRIDGPQVLAVFFLAAAVLLVGNLGFALWEPWEPKNAQTVVEMLQRGDLLTPFYRGDPRFSKPPLMYWMMALPFTLFGANEFALRLPFVLVGIAALGSFVYALHRVFGAPAAFLSAWVLLTTPLFVFLTRQLMPDGVFIAFLLAAMSFTTVSLFHEEKRTLHLALAYVSAALAVLAKGPLALVLIGGSLGLYFAVAVAVNFRRSTDRWGDTRQLLFGTLKLHWGVPLVLLLTLPWYIYNAVHYDIFLERLSYDYLDRISEPEGDHDGHWLYYVTPLLYGFFPWSILVPAGLVAWVARLRRGVWSESAPLVFLAAWFLAPFLLFSASATKFTYYIAPALAPLAALVGIWLAGYASRREGGHRAYSLGFAGSLALFLIPAAQVVRNPGDMIGSFTIKKAVNAILRVEPMFPSRHDITLAVVLLFGALLLIGVLVRGGGRRWVVGGLSVVAFGFAFFNAQLLIPALTPHKTQKFTTQTVLALQDPNQPVCVYHLGADVTQRLEWASIEASVVFYTNNHLIELISLDEAREYFGTHRDGRCIARKKYLPELRTLLRTELGLGLNVIDVSHYRYQVVQAVPLPTPRP
jgi:4-amino-4-deoxy-L-arabinose transferase-like glycosyltransferase